MNSQSGHQAPEKEFLSTLGLALRHFRVITITQGSRDLLHSNTPNSTPDSIPVRLTTSQQLLLVLFCDYFSVLSVLLQMTRRVNAGKDTSFDSPIAGIRTDDLQQ